MPAIVQTMPRIQFERDYIIFQNSIIFSICLNGGGLSEGILQDQKHKIFGFMDLCVCFFSWHVDANLPTSLYIGIFLMKFHLFLYLYMFVCVCAYKSVSVWYFCVWNHLVCIIYNATRKMFFWFISLFTDGKCFFLPQHWCVVLWPSEAYCTASSSGSEMDGWYVTLACRQGFDFFPEKWQTSQKFQPMFYISISFFVWISLWPMAALHVGVSECVWNGLKQK